MPHERTSLDLEHLACSVCLEYLLPPLYICLRGHSTACGMCFSKLGNEPECPTCRSKITNMRNFALEGIVRTTPLPCKFKESGCMSKPTGVEYPAHVLKCKFGELVNCPLKSAKLRACKWIGSISCVAGHLRNEHKKMLKSRKMGSQTLVIKIRRVLNKPGSVTAMLLESDDHNMEFLLCIIRKMNPEVAFVVQGLGTATKLTKFKISLGLVSENPRCSLRWETYPLPISEGFKWKSNDSVWSVPLKMAKAFQCNGSLRLRIKLVTINSS